MSTITIKADGSPIGTRILASTGEDISDRIVGVTFRHSAGDLPSAEVELSFVKVEAAGVPARMIGPGGKEVRRIEYADGTVDEFRQTRHEHFEARRVRRRRGKADTQRRGGWGA